MKIFTVDQLRAIYPQAKPELIAPLTDIKLFQQYGVNTTENYLHFMTQVVHETAYLTTLEEKAPLRLTESRQWRPNAPTQYIPTGPTYGLPESHYIAFELRYGHKTRPGRILGNMFIGDGAKYRGAGYLQHTGRWNFTFLGRLMNLPLANTPDILREQPTVAVKAALTWWQYKGCQDLKNIEKITLKINGGYTGLQSRKKILKELTDANL